MSDKDFFFDDEDEKLEEDAAEKPGKKPAPAAAKSARPAAASPQASFWTQTVTMSITSLVAAIALLLGVIVGIVLPVGDGGSSGVPDPATNGAISAPALSEEQLQGGLPEGHPPLEEVPGGEASGEPTGAAETTPTE